MTPDQITTLAVSEKSETLEFKETTGTRREAAMTVRAFLNQSGGARRTRRKREAYNELIGSAPR